jgi:DNA-binding beta-propeller fold protein YncE
MRLIITAFILSALYVLPSLAEPFAYVANFDSNDVSVVDLSTNKLRGCTS